MDIEKLIEQLRWWADNCDRSNYGCHARPFLLDATTALSTLQAENEKLRDELEQKSKLISQQAEEMKRRDTLLKDQEAELEQVRQENSRLKEILHGMEKG